MLAIVHSRASIGVSAPPPVTVEVHLSGGLPALSIVGLPETGVRESKDRVRSALLNAGFEFPPARRITINLAPADLPKEGGRFDLPIALGILAASGQIPSESSKATSFSGGNCPWMVRFGPPSRGDIARGTGGSRSRPFAVATSGQRRGSCPCQP